MKIKWLGLASFLITSDNGTRIITDPYETRGDLSYREISESADIVTVSHDHFDHNNVAAIRDNPKIFRKIGEADIKGIRFRGIASFHDNVGGKERGRNMISCFEVDGVKLCHLGDLGHQLTDEQVSEIGQVDVLLVPVGGVFTIDAQVATKLCDRLKPKITIPMHFMDGKCKFPIAGVDDFLRGKQNLNRLDTSEIKVRSEELPSVTQILVLRSAL
jgi:L-ascorbate metabolism protein UlaG (beta-lactamase superfamily)